jgi:hypothetical protein
MKTKPRHIFDIIIWPIIRIFWEPFSLKRSHWWHWRKYDKEITDTVTVNGDQKAQPRNNHWQDLIQTNFLWKKSIVLKPNKNTPYHLGFISKHENKCQICSIVLQGPVGLLLSPHKVEFFAVSTGENPIHLEVIGYMAKREASKKATLI